MDLYLSFIDYSKALDKVKHSDLFDILPRHNCNGKDLRVIRNLYWEQEATIRIDDDCSVYKPICRGVRHGNDINILRYADDTLLISDSKKKSAKHPNNCHSRK